MDRNDLLTRITKMRLHAESTNSEAEAMTFMEKAARMMAAYEVTEAELAEAEADGRVVLDIVEEKVDSRRNRNGRGGHAHRAAAVAGAINRLTHTKSVQYRDDNRSVSFLGHKPDVAFATQLYAVCRDSMDREYDSWKAAQVYSVPKSAKGAFQIAMASRLSSRIYEMARQIDQERKQRVADFARGGDVSAAPQIEDSSCSFARNMQKAQSSDSKALVLVDMKKEAVNSEFATRHPRLGRGSAFHYTHHSSAYAAGSAAGDRVQFNRGVGHRTHALLGV